MIHRCKRPILYVDDTVEQRYAMRRILENEGYDVIEAGSGKEALRALDSTISLAVVDVRLPDVNGYDLTRQIKQRIPHLPVLQVSASFADPSLRASGLSGGADAYIAQPVYPPELVAVVERLLQVWEAEEGLRFLANFGPRITSSLSLSMTCESICNAVCPYFSEECILYVAQAAGMDGEFWSTEIAESDVRHNLLLEHAQTSSLKIVDRRLLIAPLYLEDRRLGAIAFQLDEDREYTANDQMLALDLAHRAALALHNCLLFASEQTTQAALLKSEKLATAGRMSAAIAHEINNPLAALTNLIYLIEQSPTAEESTRSLASSALAEITRLAHITRQTLGFYRELTHPSEMDLSESVRETLELYSRRMQDKSVALRTDLRASAYIWGIKGEIRQVVSNLIVNAIEATGEEGLIVLTTRQQGTTSGQAQVRLSIADNGSGIEPNAMSHIFEPFYTTKQGTGTGLGLWVAKTIVEKHRGTITVESKTGAADHGTTFILTFPIVEAS